MLNFDLRGFIENSLLEWEDHVASVVVAGGCNLRCPYCHSWRYVTGLDGLDRIAPEVVFALLERQRGWIDGVVFTGGEPTLQPGLEDMIRRVRDYDVKIKLHSNGTRPEVIGRLLDEGLLDCLALDFKAPLDQRFFAVTGMADRPELIEAVRRSFALAAAADVDREYHTTLAPRFVDMAAFERMAAELEPGGLWILQQYRSGDCLAPAEAGPATYDMTALQAFADKAGEKHPRVLLKTGKA